MAFIIELKTITDHRGSLTVIEKILPFEIKRVFYIYGVSSPKIIRGGHRHKLTTQALIAVSGSCYVECNDRNEKKTFILDYPSKCLIVLPTDWHIMYNFSNDCVLLVLASHHYDPNDYITENYN